MAASAPISKPRPNEVDPTAPPLGDRYHAGEAMRLRTDASFAHISSDVETLLATAQVHALLEIAEQQQRTANALEQLLDRGLPVEVTNPKDFS